MDTAERLEEDLSRFFALHQYSGDTAFNARLAELQRFQTRRLRQTHAHLLRDELHRPALEFLLADIYNGLDLKPVAEDIQRALPFALKLLPNKVMATSANALEAAILTQELDEAMTRLLAERLDQPLDEAAYSQAYVTMARETERKKQLQLIGELGHQLQRYVRSRVVQTTFKMVKKPAHKTGFGHLYDFMAHCFSVMRPVPDADKLLTEISAQEAVIMQQLFAQSDAPFDISDRQPS